MELPWRLALEQGWEAFRAGNPPVGAVITDSEGATVTLGRSRFYDLDGPAGQLAGTALAHAEVNALAQLAPGDHTGLTLWSSLEPCPLCAAAAMTSRRGRVKFLASDSMWAGAEQLPTLNTAIAVRWPDFEGPQPGWPADWQTTHSGAGEQLHRRGRGVGRVRGVSADAVDDILIDQHAGQARPHGVGQIRRQLQIDAVECEAGLDTTEPGDGGVGSGAVGDTRGE